MKRTAVVLSFICWQASVALADNPAESTTDVDYTPVPEPVVAPPGADEVYPPGTVTVDRKSVV